MNSNQIVYQNVTQSNIDSLLADLKSHNSSSTVQDQGNGNYVILGHGIRSVAVYDGKSLTVTVTSKPFYVSMSMIEDGINKALGIKNSITPGSPVVLVPEPMYQKES